jgi:retinol dehydrogenase 12
LLPAVLKAAETAPQGSVRIVNTSSAGHYGVSNLNFATFKDGPQRRKMNSDVLYCQSKLGNVVFANEIARRYGDKGVVSTSVHPGVIRTELWQYSSALTTKIMVCHRSPIANGLVL